MKGGVTSQMINGAFVIYQEGGSNGPRTRTTLADALALAKSIGAAAVLVDGTMGTPTTAAVAYDWTNISLGLALWVGGNFSLDIAAGTTFTNLETVFAGLILNNKSSAPVMSVSASAEVSFNDGAGLQSDVTCTAPFFKALNGSLLSIITTSRSLLDGAGNHAVLEAATGSSVLITCGPSPAQVITDNSLICAGDVTVERGLGTVKWADVSSTQTVTGSLTITPP